MPRARPPEARAPLLRPYAPADRADCLAVFESNVPRYFRSEERAGFEAFLESLPGPYYVLLERAEVVACGGYALAAPSGRADLCWGMVRRDRHGEGLGRTLTQERMARALDDERVTCVALETSQHTVGFYERLGFEVLEAEADGYAPGLDRVRMSLRVTR